ncbi:MAG: hypothetical protein ACMG6S_36295 [Byssovorax sp.]
MNRVDLFRDLIDEPAPPPVPEQSGELVQPLHDLAQALTERAGVGARVQTSDDGRRHHLALWPLHRPAYRSLMVTVQVANGRGTVLNNARVSFTTAEELTDWLASLVQRQEFKNTLESLREQAMEPVDARLERANGMATLVHISVEQQAKLNQHPVGGELQLDVELEDGEPLPEAAALRTLNSAGVRFDVRHASLTERTVHLEVVKRS